MSQKTRSLSNPMLFTFFAALLTASQGAASTVPVIYSGVVNQSNGDITIAGNNFSPSGLAPTVVFANTALAVVSFTNQRLIATLPAGLSAGSYLLTVTNSVRQAGVFSVTIGARGPVGPQGPTGPAGPQGPAGLRGAPGTTRPPEQQRLLGASGSAAILTGYCNFSRPLREGRSNPPVGVFFLLGQLGVPGGGPYCFDGLDLASPNNEASYSPGLPIPSAGVLQNLTVVAYLLPPGLPTDAPPSFPVEVQVWVNSVAANLVCTLTLASANVNQKATCSDPLDTVAVNAGDTVLVQMRTPSPVNPGVQNLTMVVSLEKQ